VSFTDTMTTVQPSFDIMRSLSIDAIEPEIDNSNLSLPTAAVLEANPLPMYPASSIPSLSGLERAFSGDNPLVRTYSNVSVSSEAGNAVFVPYGRSTDPDTFKSYKSNFAFPGHFEERLDPLSGPNEGNITPRFLMDPVPSKVPPRSTLSPLQQEPDDFESHSQHTGTSSRITPSINHIPLGVDDDEAECEDVPPIPAIPTAVGPELNVGAQSFVPSHAPSVPSPIPLIGGFVPTTMAPPGLSYHGVNAMNAMNTMNPMNGMDVINDLNPTPNQHPNCPQQLPVAAVGAVRALNLNIPPLHIARPNGHGVHTPVGVQGSSGHRTPGNGYPQSMDRLSPATTNGMASPAGYGQCVGGYMSATPQTHTPSPLMQPQGAQVPQGPQGPQSVQQYDQYRQLTLHRPSQSPPVTSPQVGPQRGGGFSPHPHSRQHAQRQSQGHRYGAHSVQRGAPPANAGKNVDVQHMIRIGATLPQLLERRLVISFMKHQNGSRYIQERLSNASSSLITAILKRIIFEEEQIVDLSEDIFGNYVVQIFFEQFTERQDQESQQWVEWLIEYLLRGNAFRLSRHLYGCRVIQKAFDCIPPRESIQLIEEIKELGRLRGASQRTRLEECITCHHGNHVVQKIITLGLPIAHIQFVVDCVAGNIPLYSQHQYGCRIVQNIINLYGYEGNKRVLREVVKRDNLLKLCRSQYGNYVIQHVLKLNEHPHRAEYGERGRLRVKGWQHCPAKYRNDKCLGIKAQVIETVFGSVEVLSKNKYGSNVVEKCLHRATEQQAELLLNQILRPPRARKAGHGRDHGMLLREMANHQFANYVIQNIIEECKGSQLERMLNAIDSHIPQLRALKYGKHISDKINKVRPGRRYGNPNATHFKY